MEKQQVKQKNIILKWLPRAASAVFFQNHYPFSPSGDHRSKRFSGPIVSIIPEQVRRQPGQEDDVEPTSPKVSCIGQIKQKKKENIKNNKSRAAGWFPDDNNNIKKEEVKLKKAPSTLRRLFRRSKSDASSSTTSVLVSDHKVKVPSSLGEMNRLASGRREGFKSFDWTTAQIAPVDVKGYYSDDDQKGAESDQEEDEENEVIIIPFSAPITVGGGEWRSMELKPRKEVNLWQRRTMNPPRPLRLD